MMIHDYDALNWIFGAPHAVTARGMRNSRSGGFDQVQVLIDYADGASALVDGGMMMPESYPFSSRLEVLCEEGAMEYAFRAGGRSVEMGGGVNELTLYPNEGDPLRLSPAQVDPYTAECAYFVDCHPPRQPRGPRHPGRRAAGAGCRSRRARVAGTRRRTGHGSRVGPLVYSRCNRARCKERARVHR